MNGKCTTGGASPVRRVTRSRVASLDRATLDQIFPSVASDSVGNFVAAWASENQDGSAPGIFAQRYGGLGPAALTVDGAGNQVLEPGETVDVRPTWRNFSGTAVSFGGALINITGPAGAVYAVIDNAGDYGTVADDTSAACTDCYEVIVSNPPTRPVVHWDAAAVESIVPDAQDQQKQWLLHVGRSFTDVSTTSPFYRFIETLLHHSSVQRRPHEQPLLPLDRGAGPPWGGERVRRRQLLPDRRHDPRADGRLPRGDVRPDVVRAVGGRGSSP